METHHVRNRFNSAVKPALARGQLPAGDAQADDLGWRHFLGRPHAKFSSEPQRVWFERMRDKGWTVPHWPKEYGVVASIPNKPRSVGQEMAVIGARRAAWVSFGISMLGPALLKYGTEAQKKEHLPKITAGLIRWCQAIPSRTPDPISPRCKPAPRATATISSSPARRSGLHTRTTPTGFSAGAH